MKYFETNFLIKCPEELLQDARDLLSALAGETGFETFEETETGLKGYVQQALFDRDQLEQAIDSFPFEDVTITFTVEEAEDKDWNEQWEQEGFNPIIIGQRCIVHDGRHFDNLPKAMSSLADYEFSIEIDAHLAFGTGTHETTRMMLSALLDLPVLKGANVLDCGCGTGILGIAALKGGASRCTGYDIDEWSVDNARHNAIINQVDVSYSSMHGNASILSSINETFSILLANINRNILLNDMPSFRKKMSTDGYLLLSGFYQDDIPLLEEKAATLGLKVVEKRNDGDWACLVLRECQFA